MLTKGEIIEIAQDWIGASRDLLPDENIDRYQLIELIRAAGDDISDDDVNALADAIENKLSGYSYLIGRPLSDAPDIMYDCWPEVDHDGIITAILDGDCIPEDAVLIDGFDEGGEPIVTDGMNGFTAVLGV